MMARARRLLTGALLAFAFGGVARPSEPLTTAIEVVYFQANSAKPEMPERFSSTLATVAEQAKILKAGAVLVVPEGALETTSAAKKRILDARVNVVVDALLADGVARETIFVRSKFGEGVEMYNGDPARSAELNGVNIQVVPDPALYGPGYRPMLLEPTPLPASSKLPEGHLDDH
ncbi:hypothetical protein [Caulobacter sp. LARHSG274]